MPVSHLTTSESELLVGVMAELALDGYSFNASTTSESGFFATVSNALTGGSISHLTSSEVQILAVISNFLTGGSISHLTASRAEILAGILNALQNPDSPDGFVAALKFNDARNSMYIPLI